MFRLLPGLQLGDDLVVTLDLLLLGRGNRGRSNGDRRWNPSFEPVRIEAAVD